MADLSQIKHKKSKSRFSNLDPVEATHSVLNAPESAPNPTKKSKPTKTKRSVRWGTMVTPDVKQRIKLVAV